MGNTDSAQKLGERVITARRKLEEDQKAQSERSEFFQSKSPESVAVMVDSIDSAFKLCAPFLESVLLVVWQCEPERCKDIVLKSCKKVLKAPIIKSEYEWFKTYIFPSSIWMFKSIKNPDRYMYDQLLDIAELHSKTIMTSMDSIYDSLKYQNGWKQLMNIGNETFIARQDDTKVGLLKDEALMDILETKTEEDDEIQSFLDSNWCINSLVSTAKRINNEFQN
eukprot:360725_1